MPKNFFISYAHRDAEGFTRRLHDDLEGDGFQAWLDTRDITPHDNWDEAIEKGLRESIGVLVVLTPASVTSKVCRDELTTAHNLNKPILTLLITPETPDTPPVGYQDLPLLVQRKQYIDFTTSFEQGIARLRPALHRILALRRDIDAKAQEVAALEAQRPTAPRPQAVDLHIADLRGDIASQQQALLDPETFSADYQRATETQIEAERQSRKRAAETAGHSTRRRIVGSLPQGLTDNFKDRSDERGKIINLLLNGFDDDKRVVSIIGRGGVGKTALACSVLHDLEKDYEHVHGIAYLSAAARGDGISLERIFNSLGAVLGGESEKAIDDIWTNPNLTTEAKTGRLLEHLRDHRCILLFDNLEDALDDSGRIVDADVRTFMDGFLQRQHGGRILITSREPLSPADDARHYESVVPLDSGLPENFAIELLRDLDPHGELGLKDADAALLKQIADRTFGIPRALEAVVGMLATDPLLTPRDLLADARLWGEGVTEKLVARAQSRLNAGGQLVMQALALYGRPVREAAVRYLLEEAAAVIGLDVSKTLRQLARGRYLTVNRTTGEITMHPLDRDYNYRQIVRSGDHAGGNGRTVVIVLVEWETRAGDYYSQLRGAPADWKTYDDLTPVLAEFEHRVRAEDYRTAYSLINTVGRSHLRLWGYRRKELDLRQMLIGRLEDARLEAGNRFQIGHLFRDLAYYREALNAYEEVLTAVREFGGRTWEGRVLGSIGTTYWYLQDYDRALEHLQAALDITREQGERSDEAWCLHEIGLNHDDRGRKQDALAFFQESLAINQSIGNELGLSPTMANMTRIYADFGELLLARDYAQQALDIDERLSDRSGVGSSLNVLGFIDELEGRYPSALATFRRSLAVAVETGDRRRHVVVLTNIAELHPQGVSAADAEANLAAALKLAEDIASSEMLSTAHRGYADYFLRTGGFEAALRHLELAHPHIRPDRISGFQCSLGLVHWRLEHRAEAQTAFNACLDEAAKLLDDSLNLYDPKYARGLALAGLALITGDATYFEDARLAYEAGIANCPARGVLDREIERLDILGGEADAARLAGLRALLVAAHGGNVE